MKKSMQLYNIGQAIWLDNIDRNLILDGWLKRQIAIRNIWGLTSNPSIFKKAISESPVYLPAIQSMSWIGYSVKEIYEEMAVRDIQDAADLLYPVYLETGGRDGYVSIEVDPDLAYKTEETIAEAERLWKTVDRKNIFIKIPATNAGIFAIEETISNGINVNITLIFSIAQYKKVIDAYYKGLKKRIENKKSISDVHSVASFFISRIDVKVDEKLQVLAEKNREDKEKIRFIIGKAGIANALKAYQYFLESINSERFQKLSEMGANLQRPLWASTSTKNPDFSDVLYVESLVLPHTVNTLPNKTLDAFFDHGQPQEIDFGKEIGQADEVLSELEKSNIDLLKITEDLEEEGISAFSKSQEELLEIIDKHRTRFRSESQPIQREFSKIFSQLKEEGFLLKLCTKNPSLWADDHRTQKEIRNRLDWLKAPSDGTSIIIRAEKLLEDLITENYTHAVILGMGGSSLAPEVYSEIIENLGNEKESSLKVSILDSSNPVQIMEKNRDISLEKTVFIVSSKSGTTTETLSLFSYFWKKILDSGIKNPGKHFIALTDPDTPLEKIALKKKFREIISANPNVGGRYSALIQFGLVSAILSGFTGYRLMQAAEEFELKCNVEKVLEWNPGFTLGIILGSAYQTGRDKLTIITDEKLNSFGAWIEQLVAESSGKNGRGILPIVHEPIIDASEYTHDRLFVFIKASNKNMDLIDSIEQAGQPFVTQKIIDTCEIGKLFYIWETAVATACSIIGVNAFDQPNVQLSKDITKQKILDFKKKEEKILDFGSPVFNNDKMSIYTSGENLETKNKPGELLKEFLSKSDPSDFIAINAFVTRNDAAEKKLRAFRKELLSSTGMATTLGFGPRFLHSTGQLHKGGKNNGHFIVITIEHVVDLDIPKEGMTFGTLQNAQALGDIQALKNQDRRVLHIHLKKGTLDDLSLFS